MNNYNIIFESDRILFIPVNRELVNEYVKMVNDEEIQAQIGLIGRKYTKKEELEWVKNNLENKKCIFSMIEKDTYKFIGNIEI